MALAGWIGRAGKMRAMVREFLELHSSGGEVRRSWPVPSKSLGEGEIQRGAYLFALLFNEANFACKSSHHFHIHTAVTCRTHCCPGWALLRQNTEAIRPRSSINYNDVNFLCSSHVSAQLHLILWTLHSLPCLLPSSVSPTAEVPGVKFWLLCGRFASDLSGERISMLGSPTWVLQHTPKICYVFSCLFLKASQGFLYKWWKETWTTPQKTWIRDLSCNASYRLFYY